MRYFIHGRQLLYFVLLLSYNKETTLRAGPFLMTWKPIYKSPTRKRYRLLVLGTYIILTAHGSDIQLLNKLTYQVYSRRVITTSIILMYDYAICSRKTEQSTILK